ncbi:MAG: nucleotidyltransferase family protein [Candidatus Hydrothermarchaeota archaeon]|jgi:dTDP-glucose pyrophosphorylase|nr:nucleotidyltransferase family protein [Candidatus Hydrothermarchaeota archaeon]
MKVVVLAAGKGTRLLPLTKYVAKAMLPVKKKPVIEVVMENLRELSPREIIVIIGHNGEQVKDYMGDGSKYDMKITYMTQEVQDGTAKALQLAMEGVDGDVIVSACDSLVPGEHIRELRRYHIAEECDATLSLKALDRRVITKSSSVSLEKDGTISRIIEKPREWEILSDVASSPLYVFSEAIKEYLPKVARSRRGEYEIQDTIQRMIDDGLRVKGIISDSGIHLSTIEDFLMLNFDYMKRWLQ